MEEITMIIKNGKVVLFKNEDVIVKDVDLKIENGKIVRIERNIEAEDSEKLLMQQIRLLCQVL